MKLKNDDETKVELFGKSPLSRLCRKNGTAHQHQNLTVSHGGQSIIVSACLTSSGPGQLAIVNGKMNSEMCKDILLKTFRGEWVLQQDTDPKHRSKQMTEWLQKKKTFFGVDQSKAWPQPH